MNKQQFNKNNLQKMCKSSIVQENIGFKEFQSIPTHAAMHIKYFNINNSHFIAIANPGGDEYYNIDSKI
jgi:hypothetical protein